MNINLFGLAWLLTAILAGAKLLGYAAIGWLTVFAPVLFSLAILVTVLLIGFAVVLASVWKKG